MKKRIIAVLLALGLVAVLAIAVNAQIGSDSVTLNTSWTFQNLGGSTATVHVDLFSTAGSLIASDDITVAKSAGFYAPNYAPLDTAGTFNGGIVASSSEPLAATSNQVAVNNTAGRTGNATYVGFTADTVAPTLYAPSLMKGFGSLFWTELSIQSTATTGDITVDVHYYNEDGSEVVGSPVAYIVHAGSPTRVAQADETILPAGWIGSTMVEAQDGTTDLAMIVNELMGGTGLLYGQFYSYEGFASGAERVVVPNVFVDGYGGAFNASATVQNLGSIPANVIWRFYDNQPGNPAQATEIMSFTEVLTTSKAVYFPNETYVQTLKDAYTTTSDIAAGEWVGTVVFESTNGQPLVAIVNELQGTWWAASFTGLTEGGTELYYPMAYVDAFGGYAQTSYAIVDMSGTPGPVNVTVNYIADKDPAVGCPTCGDWSTTYDFSVNDNQYQPVHLATAPAGVLGTGDVYIGSLKITVNTAGKTINGVMNEVLGFMASTEDNFTAVNGTAVTP